MEGNTITSERGLFVKGSVATVSALVGLKYKISSAIFKKLRMIVELAFFEDIYFEERQRSTKTSKILPLNNF